MRLLAEVPLGDRKVMVKELTLAEIRAWLEEAAQRLTVGLVDELFDDKDLSISDLPSFCDMAADQFEGFGPSELEPLVDKIREVNARFFVTWRRRLAATRQMHQAPPGLPAASLP